MPWRIKLLQACGILNKEFCLKYLQNSLLEIAQAQIPGAT